MFFLTNQVSAEIKPIDNIEAVVNKDIILSSDLNRAEKELKSFYRESKRTLPTGIALKKQLLDKLINDRLLLQVAEQIGLRIKDAQVDQTLQKIAKDKKLTLNQFKVQFEKNGRNYNAFVDGIRNELTINEVRQIKVRQRIHISDQEVQQMVERLNKQGEKTTQFHFVHILLKIKKNSSAAVQEATLKEAKNILNKLKQGKDASTLAVKYSQGPKALQGGDWGWRTIDNMPTLFATVFNNKQRNKGDLIGPFRSELGLHLFKIIDKKGAKNTTTVEVNARHILIKSNIIVNDKKAQELLKNYRQQILDKKETFSTLAKLHSQDPGSAIKGGDLGWADPRMYVPEFKDKALSLKIGKISQPFRTVHGWHILQVIDRRKTNTTKQATKQKAFSILFNQRFPKEAYTWLNELREEAYIKINNPEYIIEAK